MIEIEEYLDENGHSAFGAWFDKLDSQAALKVTTYLARIETGNTSQINLLVAVYQNAVSIGVQAYRFIWHATERQ